MATSVIALTDLQAVLCLVQFLPHSAVCAVRGTTVLRAADRGEYKYTLPMHDGSSQCKRHYTSLGSSCAVNTVSISYLSYLYVTTRGFSGNIRELQGVRFVTLRRKSWDYVCKKTLESPSRSLLKMSSMCCRLRTRDTSRGQHRWIQPENVSTYIIRYKHFPWLISPKIEALRPRLIRIELLLHSLDDLSVFREGYLPKGQARWGIVELGDIIDLPSRLARITRHAVYKRQKATQLHRRERSLVICRVGRDLNGVTDSFGFKSRIL